MKNKVLVLLTLLALACVLCCSVTEAETISSGSCDDNNNVTWTLTDEGVLTISGTGAMEHRPIVDDKSKIKQVVIEYGVTKIASGSFSQYTNLTDVTIPNSVIIILADAFLDCTSLAEITIPDSVTAIASGAFGRCSSLTNITIPENVTIISHSVFSECSSLTNIRIPGNVTSIGDFAFRACSSLTEITIPENVTSIGKSAFRGCSSLTEITIPESVTSIGNSVFYGCRNLTKITIPENVTSIGDSAFYICSNLAEIMIPENVTSIGSHAFEECSSLSSITIPEGVTTIGAFAFSGCRSLLSITIPKNVASIGESALKNCVRLSRICFLGKQTAIGNNIVTKTPKVYCYSGSTAHSWALEKGLDLILLDNADPQQHLAITIPEAMRISVNRETRIPTDIFAIRPVTSVSWRSGDESVVTVDEKGILTPEHLGTAVVTITVDGKEAQTTVTVCPVMTAFDFPDTFYMISGEPMAVPLRVYPVNAFVEFELKNAGIDASFLVTENETSLFIYGNSDVESPITIADKISGMEIKIPLQISYHDIDSAKFEQKEVNIRAGQRMQLKTHVVMGSYQFDNQLVVWEYVIYPGDNSGCISLNRETGEITGVSAGKAHVRVYKQFHENSEDYFDECVITVTDGPGGETLQLPSGIEAVSDEAFRGSAAENIMIPDGVKAIGSYAFADSEVSCVWVHIPPSVTYIHPNAFSGCAEVIIFGKSGSEAETYANTHDNCSFVAE